MKMYLAIVILCGLAACATPKSAVVSSSACDYSTLRQVAAAPQQANGKMLCSELYSYSKHGFLAFYDQPIRSTAEALQKEALLIGEEDASANFRGTYPSDGQRVRVRGILNLQLSCFVKTKDSCAPIVTPIYVNAPKFSIIR